MFAVDNGEAVDDFTCVIQILFIFFLFECIFKCIDQFKALVATIRVLSMI